MKHLIVGYGYTGFYLAQALLEKKQRVWTVSRTLADSAKIKGVIHLKADIHRQPDILDMQVDVIHYLIPPLSKGRQDTALRQWLILNQTKTRKIIYYGSSGVYGDQQGMLVDEVTPCNLQFDRQYRRLDAETQLLNYGEKHDIAVILLRIAGIYGANRIPYQNIKKGICILKVSEAPWSNTIYVKDLVKIAILLATKLRRSNTFNISDGIATPMGSNHRLLAAIMQTYHVMEQSFEEIWAAASPMKKEFLSSSKKLSIEKLKKVLAKDLIFTDKVTALKESLAQTYQDDALLLLKKA